MRSLTYLIILSSIILFQNCTNEIPENWQWETVKTIGQPTARHEAGLVSYQDKLYLMGGRRVNPTSVYDPLVNEWTEHSPTPLEIHHFQPVVYGDKIYIVGAMTGKWPNETPLEKVMVYDPEKDEYQESHDIPVHRRRGGAGVAVFGGKIYIVGGITHGHQNGYKNWMDEYNPETGEWITLPDAPHNRDHFQAIVNNDKLYAFAGRRTSHHNGNDMNLTSSHGNVFDLKSKKWEQVSNNLSVPTMRAGNSAFVWNNDIIIGGGESMAHEAAHDEVEAFNTSSGLWSKWPSLNQGRHGTGFAIIGDYVYIASGCGKRGGEPELTSLERLQLPKGNAKPISKEIDQTPVYSQWHTITIPFHGPETSETDDDNPFLNYRLSVEFSNESGNQMIRGYYAADGNAGETSAAAGNIWQVRFTPDKAGEWTYSATLQKGDSIALIDDIIEGDIVSITNNEGKFSVMTSDKEGPDFRANGRLIADKGFFKFENTHDYWMKAGANSPENFLAFEGFDDTYRIKAEAREGEASALGTIHSFDPHIDDWKTGDPTWQNGKGKAIIGATNYLASKGMNSIYFLTMNILGDGKDVWPYASPDDFTRFDVSKLDQWEVVFQHMQSKGILLHFVTQETENETMLDNGNTGPMRQLYYRELIARFGHHLGLVWNLGEENGPADWTPIGQNDAQRKAMASFINDNDPYNHPILLHTHSYDPIREDILNDIIGYKDLDGLSFQQADRTKTSEQIEMWRKKSKEKGHEWLIAMDEIGEWHTAVKTDEEEKDHASLRGSTLWGSLMSGAAGVEWYFGARHPHNDLTSEDWRQRDRLWELTYYAKDFFDQYLPYWDMEADHNLIRMSDAFCLKKEDEIYAIYLPSTRNVQMDLTQTEGEYNIEWYNPLKGGELLKGTIKNISGGKIQNLGIPPSSDTDPAKQDWVVLIRKA